MPAGARADALADLKTALARTAVQAPLRAAIESQTWRKLGEGADADEDSGQASVLAEDGPRGLSLTHAREMVARMERELQARARNPNSKTPTMAALEEMGPHDVLALTCASAALSRARNGACTRASAPIPGRAGRCARSASRCRSPPSATANASTRKIQFAARRLDRARRYAPGQPGPGQRDGTGFHRDRFCIRQ
ncbi:hypothetical protein LP419_17575 [Massilia sp. H-1]|nr:hypothetical protein LP419_17575 [Massilia sp. H-1]